MTRELKSMDGNNAAAHVSYAFTEVAGIYPITPSSPMADYVDELGRPGPQEHLRHHGEGRARCSPRAARPARFTALWPPAR